MELATCHPYVAPGEGLDLIHHEVLFLLARLSRDGVSLKHVEDVHNRSAALDQLLIEAEDNILGPPDTHGDPCGQVSIPWYRSWGFDQAFTYDAEEVLPSPSQEHTVQAAARKCTRSVAVQDQVWSGNAMSLSAT